MEKLNSYVLVATDNRGVFAGVLESHDEDNRVAVLKDARQVVYWSAGSKGFLGMAANGPATGSRVSPAAPHVELPGTHCVAICSDEARAAFEAGPWS